ncbi:MAG: gamma-glutamyltransferase [Natronomonas sp.]
MYQHTALGRQPTRTTNAMITTPHSVASSAGLDALRRGGSAVDAAIAANAALCVVYPHMAGLGGDGFWMIADRDDVRAINASGPAASDATRAYYTDSGYDEIPDRGAESALTVPGAVDGWRLAHEAYGTLPWEELFTNAIELATESVVTDNLSGWIRTDRDIIENDERASSIFLPGDTVPEPGDRLQQTALADSLETVARRGSREGFYEGPLAERICEPLRERGSPLHPEDFAEYTAEWVEPLSIEYRDYTAHSFPPNTQGIAALEILGLLDGFDLEAFTDGTPEYYHAIVEATKLAFADRDAWVTDPDFVDIPTETLLDSTYLDNRREQIDFETALPPSPAAGTTPETHTPTEGSAGGDTCYFSVVDEDGLAVSVIQSIYYDFGSGVVAGDTGIIPQNRGSFFSLDPDHVNALEPGKRTFHTLIPSILTKDGEPRLVYGTMGGEGQPQTQAALVSRIVDFGYDVQRAIEAPRWLFGRTWGEESRSLTVEGRVPDGVIDALRARGQTVSVARDYDDTMGHAGAIRITEDGTLVGGADPRGDGAALGY